MLSSILDDDFEIGRASHMNDMDSSENNVTPSSLDECLRDI